MPKSNLKNKLQVLQSLIESSKQSDKRETDDATQAILKTLSSHLGQINKIVSAQPEPPEINVTNRMNLEEVRKQLKMNNVVVENLVKNQQKLVEDVVRIVTNIKPAIENKVDVKVPEAQVTVNPSPINVSPAENNVVVNVPETKEPQLIDEIEGSITKRAPNGFIERFKLKYAYQGETD